MQAAKRALGTELKSIMSWQNGYTQNYTCITAEECFLTTEVATEKEIVHLRKKHDKR
jgi:hypothetical protein